MLSDGFLLELNLGAKLKFMELSSVGRITVDYDWFRWYNAISQDNDNSQQHSTYYSLWSRTTNSKEEQQRMPVGQLAFWAC